MNKKKIVKTYIILFLAAAITVGTVFTVNFAVDPLALCNKDGGLRESSAVAEMMAEGVNAGGINNLVDERLVKRLYAENHMTETDVLVLGSSRAALIDSTMLGGASLVNLSVAAAELREVAALYGIVREQGCLPDRVILSIDLWWLNDNYTSKRFHASLADAYDRFAETALGYADSGVDPSTVQPQYIDPDHAGDSPLHNFMSAEAETREEFFSVAYFQQSLKWLFTEGASVFPVHPETHYSDEYAMIRSDGSYCYPASFRNTTASQAYDNAALSLPESILGSEDFYELEGDMAALFRDLIVCMQRDGVEVQLIMTPIHPMLYAYMQQHERYAVALCAEQWYRDTAAVLGVPIVGSFDVYQMGMDDRSFYDGYHYKTELVALLVKEVEMQ